MDRRQHAYTTGADQAQVLLAAADETVLEHVEGVGATLVVTATRAIVVRQGAHFRPRNGVRSWPLNALRAAQLVAPYHGNGRVVLRTGPYPWQAVSLFIPAQQWPAAERAVGQIRVRLARARRSSGSLGTSNPGTRAPRPPKRD